MYKGKDAMRKLYRHELKYQICFSDYLAIRQRLRPVMKPDKYAGADGRYVIRSVYFDNAEDKALREKINGVQKREKFRLRYYNDDLSFIVAEKKLKYNNLCMKTKARLSEAQCRAILAGDHPIAFADRRNTPAGVFQIRRVPPVRIIKIQEENKMSFNDIFKSTFLESVSEFSIIDTILGLAAALVIGLFIFIIYKKTLTGVMYSSGFALTLVGLSLVTTLVIMAVTSNVVLSLGMVGALSIIGSVLIGLILLLFANRKIHNNPYILVLNLADEETENNVLRILEQSVEHFVVKSKTVNGAGIELTTELRTKDATTSFVNRIQAVSGVENAILVSYNGEYMA